MLTVDKYVAFVYSFHVCMYGTCSISLQSVDITDMDIQFCPFVNITCLLISISWEVLLCGRDDD